MPVFRELDSFQFVGAKRIEWEDGSFLTYGGRFSRRMGAKAPKERSFRVRTITIVLRNRTVRISHPSAGGWVLRWGSGKAQNKPITHAATLAMLDGISVEPDRLTRELCWDEASHHNLKHPAKIAPWEGLGRAEIQKVLEAVHIPFPLWDSLCDEFPELLFLERSGER